MQDFTELQYQYALERIEDLLPLVDESTSRADKNYIELELMSELISSALEEKQWSQKELARKAGVSPSRISDYVIGRAEPTLKVASRLCLLLGIAPAAMMGL